jgi:hypothetical protein
LGPDAWAILTDGQQIGIDEIEAAATLLQERLDGDTLRPIAGGGYDGLGAFLAAACVDGSLNRGEIVKPADVLALLTEMAQHSGVTVIATK